VEGNSAESAAAVITECCEVEMLALDWGGHSKKSHNARLRSNRFMWNHRLSEHCSFVK